MTRKLYRLAIWYIGKCNAKWNKSTQVIKSKIKSLKRLTYRSGNKAYLSYGIDAEWKKFGRYDVLNNAIQRLAEYEDLKDKNLLKIFSCKVGDTVYRIDINAEVIKECTVEAIYCGTYGTDNEWHIKVDGFHYDLSDIGKSIFLTQDAVNTALKSMKKEKIR